MLNTQKTETHPQYARFLKTWIKMRDVFEDEEHIKVRVLEQNSTNLDGVDLLKPIVTFDQYLRPTDSMRRLGILGYQRFCDYIYRAKWYAFPLEVQHQSMGLIENQASSFELPTDMDGLLSDSTVNNESLQKVMSLVNIQQLRVSRVGCLLIPSNEDDKPFNIAMYYAESIVDWHIIVGDDSDAKFDWVKLKTDKVFNNKPVFLILNLQNDVYFQYETINASIKYGDDFMKTDGFILDSYIEPESAENKINEIPFIIINVTQLGGNIERPFLESIADSSISLFRASAHHQDALFWGGESTLFTRGYGLDEDDERIYVGNGAMNKSNVQYADAKYVTMGIDGIKPRFEDFVRLFEYCVSLGVDLLNKGSESGKALNIRSNVKTASLKTLVQTAALGLEMLLKIGARWMGADPEKVVIKPNTQFSDAPYTAADFQTFATLVDIGAMRMFDFFILQQKYALTIAEDFEEWAAELEKRREEKEKLKTQQAAVKNNLDK